MVTKTRTITLLAVGVLIGATLKCGMLSYMGVVDMNSYYLWGGNALHQGLPNYYPGIYYPVQIQFFEISVWAAEKFDISPIILFKLSNLLFDIGVFILLLLLLNRQGANPLYALVYWLHPFFLTVFSLGYVDFQFSFFVLLCLCLLRHDSTADYIVAGIPLAVAFVMKPQAQVLVVAVFFYSTIHYVKNRDLRPFALLAAPVALFLAYDIWFTISAPGPWYRAGAILPASYLNVTNIMPCLTAQMPNVWTPVAWLLKQPGQYIPNVSDRIHILPFVPAKYLAACVVLALVGLHVWMVDKESSPSVGDKFARVFFFACLAVPFLMTSAHENHLFLAMLFLVLLLATSTSWKTRIAGHILLVTQFINVHSLYEERPDWLAQLLHPVQSDDWQVVYAVISMICFWFIAKSLWSGDSA